MSFIKNQFDSHIILNVERIDLNEKIKTCSVDPLVLEKQLYGIIAEAFEHLKSLSHLNICSYTNMLRLDGNAYLFFSESYSLTLNQIFDQSCEQLSRLNCVNTVNQILSGLYYLHSLGLSHGRLTLESICISDDGLVKITGYASNYINNVINYLLMKTSESSEIFRWYKEKHNNYLINQLDHEDRPDLIEYLTNSPFLFNNLVYMPPELLFFDKSSANCNTFWYNVDIWSVGICILFIISYGLRNMESVDSKSNDVEELENDNDRVVEGTGDFQKNINFFDRVMNIFSPEKPRCQFIESFLFVSYLLVLINKNEGDKRLSTLGLDVVKIVNEQFKFLTNEDKPECEIGLVLNVFKDVNPKYEGFKNEKNTEDNSKVMIDVPLEDDIVFSINLLTGGDVLRKLIVLTNKPTNKNYCSGPDLLELQFLLTLMNDCLIISNDGRPPVLELITKRNTLKLTSLDFRTKELSYSWFTYKHKQKDSELKDSFNQYDSVELLKESHLGFSESIFFLNLVDLENVPYYWALLGNDPSNTVPFNFKTKAQLDVEDSESSSSEGGFYLKNRKLEYFRRYKVGKVFLGELISHVRLANLFPMIIEHQLRPSCVYARQNCFIYQMLRIRRFKRLLSSPVENKRKIFVESTIDIPPVLRKYIWCNLLDIIYKPSKKACPINSNYKMEPIPPELEQNLNFYNKDVLYSTTNINKLISNVNCLRNKIIHQQLPSSIYSFAIPLLLLYHNSQVYSSVLEKIFCKYLREFYAPTGSFVNNYLSEFGTILNFFDPEISQHLRKIGAYADSYALPWFMSLFSENTAVDQLYIIWDSILVQPKQYIKFLAVMILHNIRERLLSINDASIAISFISCVMDSLNIPMLMYLTTHMFNTWHDLLNPRPSSHKQISLREEESKDESDMTDSKSEVDNFNLDKNTFVFKSDEYPLERCFKLSIEAFSNISKNCIIIDLRSIESYNLGHIPNSVHIGKVISSLSESDKKNDPLSLYIFNEHNGLNKNMDFNGNASNSQTLSSLHGLRNMTKKPWLHLNSRDSGKVVLAAGDGYDVDNEMFYINKLVFEFSIQHVCYYRINTEEWPKLFTLSKI